MSRIPHITTYQLCPLQLQCLEKMTLPLLEKMAGDPVVALLAVAVLVLVVADLVVLVVAASGLQTYCWR